MSSPQTSRTVRVFLSSTFRDFAEERDLLVKKVFPELRRRCRERQVELVDVDLRWGITEEQAQRGEVLPICLAEIDRSRPYFMGFIGDRYGWVPEYHQYDLSLLVEQPWLEEHRGGKSVTELEMLHGVLNNPKMKDRAFFYFRNSEYSQSKGGPYLSEGLEDAAKLEELKDRIRTSGFPVEENYPNPEALAERVMEDLWKVIDEAYPEEDVPDPLTLERRKHEAYGGSRLGLYLGGKQYVQALDAAMKEEAFKPVLITGASGGGKSALIANWSRAYSEKHPETLEIVHYLGSGADAGDPVKLVTRLLQEIARITGEELKLESDPQKILDALPEWLARASSYAEREGKEWLVLFDGLDKLSSLRDLRWWPGFLPPRVKLVVSCLDGEVQDEARKRMEWTALEVLPLSPSEGVEVLQEYLRQFNKTLPPPECALIAAHPLSTSPLFVRILAEEMRVFGQHELLHQKLQSYLSASTIDGLFTKVLERIEGDNKVEDVRASLSAIWASRAGLAQEELLSITGLVPATWAPIRNALNEALLESSGRIQFAHDYLRQAMEERYLSSEDLEKQSHVRIAEWFSSQEVTPRVAEELPWQWEMAGEKEKLNNCLTNRALFSELYECNPYELLAYWLGMPGQNIEKEYEKAWHDWIQDECQEREVQSGKKLARFLCTAGYYGFLAEALDRQILEYREKEPGSDHPATFDCLDDLGTLLILKGNYEEAESLYRRVIRGREKILGPDHTDTLRSLNNLGNLLADKGDYNGAEEFYQLALAGRKKHLGPNHLQTLGTINNLGNLLADKGDYRGGENLLRIALEGKEKHCGPDHPDTLMSLYNLGILLRKKGDYEEAKKISDRVLKGREKILGSNHPDVLSCLNSFGNLLAEQGDYTGAESLYRRSLEGKEKVLGLDHPSTLMSLNNLGGMLASKGDEEGAEKIFRRVLEIREKELGTDHPDTLMSLFSLGNLLAGMGLYEDAEKFYCNSLKGREKALGLNHPDTLMSLNGLGNLLADLGEYEGAEKFYRKALNGSETALGADHPDALMYLNNLGFVLSKLSKNSEAVELFKKAYGISPRSADSCRYNLARCECLLGHLETAKQFISEHLMLHPDLKELVLEDPDFDSVRGYIESL